ncbi:MAG: peptidase U32 family protein [Spirochaetota bacterium]|nr:peptidase U32 family protein [Spirochaetota bacterium]
MTISIDNGNNIEIVSPAGNLEKLKIAVRFGADAVYFGGKRFNLRNNTGNLSLQEIEEALTFCKTHRARTIFLLNSFLHEGEIREAEGYIEEIKDFKFDAFVVSDPGMFVLLKEKGIDSNIHLSTQFSILNHLSIKFWNSLGINRIILARETTLDEIKSIREHTDAEIEIFVHGALCISYSGRCLLSRYLSGRDANQGNCSHPCRWNYALVEEKRNGNHMDIIEYASGTEILSSKDLCLIERLSDYISAGVNAFKIEGRMKSLYYTANTTRIYSHAVRVLTEGCINGNHMPFWLSELDLVSHRPYTDNLFNEFDDLEFSKVPYIRKALFLGYYLRQGKDKTEAFVKTFNPIYQGEEIEAIFPIQGDTVQDDKFHIREIIEDEESVEMAQPGRECLIKFDKGINNDAVFRRRR